MSGSGDERKSGDQAHLVAAAWLQVEPLWSTAARDGSHAAAAPAGGAWDTGSIPGYQIEAELQRGGQGVVYRGIQESTQRQVAIKVMRDGPFAGPRERARFEREVQILAQLRHPNIVTIHDSGIAGHAMYFVMDYIPGEPLDRYVAAHAPDLTARLGIFAKICAAVNVAHLRGVIHRDLKPGNLRVDPSGEPHVLDFGLAKHSALAGPDDSGAAMTVTGQFVGSLPWASPEQAEGRSDQIDLRTDVYSLGVILYQLLTGEFPYEVSGSLGQTTHNIVHREARHPRTLNRRLDDEICTIVLKALRKERDDRYQTAGDLGRDVERYLANEPIEAKRDSMTYMIRKQLARHRIAAGVAFAFVLIVSAGFVVSASFWREAVVARDAERVQKQIAVERAERAAAESAKAQAVSDFLTSMLESASPMSTERPNITVREAVDAAAVRLDGEAFADQPGTEAAVRRVIGTTNVALGQFPEAIRHLQAAHDLYARLGQSKESDALMCTFRLADAIRSQGDLATSEKLFDETLRTARAELGGQHALVATGLNGLADVLRDGDRLEDAEKANREALAILRAQPEVKADELSTVLNDLALGLHQQARYDEALQSLSESLELARAHYGPRHRAVGVALNNRASLYGDLRRFDEALADLNDALAIFRAVEGERHPDIAAVKSVMGVLLLKKRDFAEAKPLLEEALTLRRELLGEDHPQVAHGLNNLATAEYELGNLDAAAEGFAAALAVFKRAWGPNHPSLATLTANLAGVQRTRGDLDAAIPLLREALAMHLANYPPGHPKITLTQYNLGRTLMDAGQNDEAEDLLRAALGARRAAHPGDHADVATSLEAVATLELNQGQLDEAEASARESLAMRLRLVGENQLDLTPGMETLGSILLEQGDVAGAADLFAQALTIAERHLEGTHWRVGLLRTELAEALMTMGLYADAEPLLLTAYDALAATHGNDDDRTQRTVLLVVEVYDALQAPERAQPWRDRLVSATLHQPQPRDN